MHIGIHQMRYDSSKPRLQQWLCEVAYPQLTTFWLGPLTTSVEAADLEAGESLQQTG